MPRRPESEMTAEKYEFSRILNTPHPDTAWILGVLSAVGNIREPYSLLLYSTNKEFADKAAGKFQALFGISPRQYKRVYKNPKFSPGHELYIGSANLISYIHSPGTTRLMHITENYPWVLNKNFIWPFLSGMVESDGNIFENDGVVRITLHAKNSEEDKKLNDILFRAGIAFSSREAVSETEFPRTIFLTKREHVAHMLRNLSPDIPNLQKFEERSRVGRIYTGDPKILAGYDIFSELKAKGVPYGKIIKNRELIRLGIKPFKLKSWYYSDADPYRDLCNSGYTSDFHTPELVTATIQELSPTTELNHAHTAAILNLSGEAAGGRHIQKTAELVLYYAKEIDQAVCACEWMDKNGFTGTYAYTDLHQTLYGLCGCTTKAEFKAEAERLKELMQTSDYMSFKPNPEIRKEIYIGYVGASHRQSSFELDSLAEYIAHILSTARYTNEQIERESEFVTRAVFAINQLVVRREIVQKEVVEELRKQLGREPNAKEIADHGRMLRLAKLEKPVIKLMSAMSRDQFHKFYDAFEKSYDLYMRSEGIKFYEEEPE